MESLTKTLYLRIGQTDKIAKHRLLYEEFPTFKAILILDSCIITPCVCFRAILCEPSQIGHPYVDILTPICNVTEMVSNLLERTTCGSDA